MQLWFAIFKDHRGKWAHITGDDGEIYMWRTKAAAERALKKHWARHILHFCNVVTK